MTINIESSIASLQQINVSLKNNFNETKLNKIIFNTNNILKELETNLRKGFTPLSDILRPEIYEVLYHLHQTLVDRCGKDLEKIQTVTSKILQLQNAIEIAPLNLEKKIIPIDVKTLAFFCDFESDDHNLGIGTMVKQALNQDLPFITTRSLIQGTGYKDRYATSIPKFLIESQELVIQKQKSWDIFQKGELLVFIPKSYLSEKSSVERLAAFDFKTDGTLQPVSAHEVLQSPRNKPNIDDFIDLFVPEAKEHKLFYLAGHGFINLVGGLGIRQYEKFLNFLVEHCKGLAILSCFSGGQNSLLNIPMEVREANFLNKNKSHSFPILIRSLGDFTAVSRPEDLHGFLKEFAAYIGLGESLSQLRHRIEKLEEGKQKHLSNLIQIYPPHSAGSPAAFRSLGEGKKGVSLTYALVKRTKISPTYDELNVIKIKDAELLEVYPLVTDVPIQFIHKNPVLVSKAPGKGHHYIKSIHLATENVSKYMKSVTKFYKEMGFGVDEIFGQSIIDKGFFIESIKNPKNGNVNKIALKLSSTKSFFSVKDREKYYFVDDVNSLEIDSLTYAIINFEIYMSTKGEERAIRAMSDGQETESNFQEAIIEADFLPYPFFSLFNLNNDNVDCTSQFSEKLETLSVDQKASIIIFLLKCGHSKKALEIYRSLNLEVMIEDIYDHSLLNLAIKADEDEFVEYILSQNFDPIFLLSSSKMPPLHLAINRLRDIYERLEKGEVKVNKIIEKREKILNYLLSHPKIDLQVKNSNGYLPIVEAFPNSHLVRRLIEKGLKINNCLGLFVGKQDYQSVNILLELKASPNENYALEAAIKLNDEKLVRQLLQAGAIIESREFNLAILQAFPKIIQLLLETENCPLTKKDNGQILPMFAALISGDDEKISMLKAKKAPMPNSFFWKEELLMGIFKRLLSIKGPEGLSELLQSYGNFNLIREMIKYLLDKDIQLLKHFIALDKINVNDLNISGEDSILNFILQESHDLDLIELSFNKIIDFNKSDLFVTLVKYGRLEWIKGAVEQKKVDLKEIHQRDNTLALEVTNLDKAEGIEIFKWLVTQGANLNIAMTNKNSPFCHAIASGDIDLVKYCLEKGAQIVFKDPNSINPLAFAANQQKNNSGEIFKLLFIHSKENINSPALSPAPTLFAALANYSNLEMIKWALEQGAQVNPKCNAVQSSPLSLAAKREDDVESKIFKELIKAGASIESLSKKAVRGLMKRGNKDLIEYCYNNGLEEKILDLKHDSIMTCIRYKHAQQLEFLLGKYKLEGLFSYELVENKFAEIASEGDLAMMQVLFNQRPKGLGLNPLYNKVSVEGKKCSFFECALKAKPGPKLEIIRFLLDHGDDPKQQIDGGPALYYAVNISDYELVKILLDKGGDEDILTKVKGTGLSALELARTKNDSILTHLLENAAKVKSVSLKTPVDS